MQQLNRLRPVLALAAASVVFLSGALKYISSPAGHGHGPLTVAGVLVASLILIAGAVVVLRKNQHQREKIKKAVDVTFITVMAVLLLGSIGSMGGFKNDMLFLLLSSASVYYIILGIQMYLSLSQPPATTSMPEHTHS